ncbi:endoglucanase [Methylomarinovum caldicuralii]|uniref:Glucanase n=1 Tax=Methylomarinovum caldicuralii TaxID=438856 RepID=A0AAU9BV42_9GAMM|nr:glycosyl hydrolase family 8 [Methylomarinovum caldicuralii]BCX82848.1 endoglucanase [Methylomarinovum caldicuralii]
MPEILRPKGIFAALLCIALLPSCAFVAPLESLWESYKTRFIQNGRVVDTGNQGVTHSEGQGYGMLLAVAAGDRPTFESLWQWTRANLQVRGDHLFMWRHRPHVPLSQEDPNNATDGDLLIAWALLEAAGRWNEPIWEREARAILADLKPKIVRRWHSHTVLLPGAYGFEHQGRLTLNLSYWVFPALRRFAAADSDPVWRELVNGGLALIRQARFGTWKLPSDWVEAAETLQPDPKHPPRFGYDAVRIPLYLVWGGYHNRELLSPFVDFWKAFGGFLPPWLDLELGCVGAYPASGGTRAIYNLSRFAIGKSWWLYLPSPTPKDAYYSTSLILLSHLAARRIP